MKPVTPIIRILLLVASELMLLWSGFAEAAGNRAEHVCQLIDSSLVDNTDSLHPVEYLGNSPNATQNFALIGTDLGFSVTNKDANNKLTTYFFFGDSGDHYAGTLPNHFNPNLSDSQHGNPNDVLLWTTDQVATNICNGANPHGLYPVETSSNLGSQPSPYDRNDPNLSSDTLPLSHYWDPIKIFNGSAWLNANGSSTPLSAFSNNGKLYMLYIVYDPGNTYPSNSPNPAFPGSGTGVWLARADSTLNGANFDGLMNLSPFTSTGGGNFFVPVAIDSPDNAITGFTYPGDYGDSHYVYILGKGSLLNTKDSLSDTGAVHALRISRASLDTSTPVVTYWNSINGWVSDSSQASTIFGSSAPYSPFGSFQHAAWYSVQWIDQLQKWLVVFTYSGHDHDQSDPQYCQPNTPCGTNDMYSWMCQAYFPSVSRSYVESWSFCGSDAGFFNFPTNTIDVTAQKIYYSLSSGPALINTTWSSPLPILGGYPPNGPYCDWVHVDSTNPYQPQCGTTNNSNGIPTADLTGAFYAPSLLPPGFATFGTAGLTHYFVVSSGDPYVPHLMKFTIPLKVRNNLDNINDDRTSNVLMRDLNADGYQGQWEQFTMANGSVVSSNSFNASNDPDYVYQSMMDANGDGVMDVLVRSAANPANWYYYPVTNGNTSSATPTALTLSVPASDSNWANWQFQSAGDFDGDGNDDILIRNTVSGNWWIYYLNAGAVINSAAPPTSIYTSTSIAFQAAADFNGDGRADILYRNMSNGQWWTYNLVNGTNTYMNFYLNLGYTFQAVVDLNGDGKQDVITRWTGASGDGRWVSYQLGWNGTAFTSTAAYVQNQAYYNLNNISLASYGDFNGDGRGDLLMYDTSSNPPRYDLFVSNSSGVLVGGGYPAFPTPSTNWTMFK